MYIKRSDEADLAVINFKKSLQRQDRTQQLSNYTLRDVKQVELYTKFWKFVPQEFQDEICPRPSDEVLKNMKQSRSQETKARNDRKMPALASIGWWDGDSQGTFCRLPAAIKAALDNNKQPFYPWISNFLLVNFFNLF